MSWFGSAAPSGPTTNLPPLGEGSLHPVSKRYDANSLFGQLTPEDTSWLAQASGFAAETQVFYSTLPGGQLVMCQVIHSGIGLWYPQIQFTFRYYDPHTKESIWKSVNVSNFKTPAPATGGAKYDKRSCRSDQFSILLDPAKPDQYTISGKYDDEVQVRFTFQRCPRVPGWKVGNDARGGVTYFGLASGKPSPSPDLTAGGDGYVVHRFWPRCIVNGSVVIKGAAKDLDGGRGIFIHAIQGMRANLIASRWNFCNFQSVPSSPGAEDPGVSVTLMEFTTVPGTAYGGPTKITVGSVVVGDRLVSVTCGPSTVKGAQAMATHEAPLVFDPETEYRAPSALRFDLEGPSLIANPDGTATVANALPSTKVEVMMHVADEAGGCKDGNYVTKGLIEKVDFMAQIPYLVKKVIAAVAGARPFIYTWMNPTTANIQIPAQLLEDRPEAGSDMKTLSISGSVFVEATFISDI